MDQQTPAINGAGQLISSDWSGPWRWRWTAALWRRAGRRRRGRPL